MCIKRDTAGSPPGGAVTKERPFAIVASPDGALRYVNSKSSSVGRITTG